MIIQDIMIGNFVERPNRFTVIFNAGEENVTAHLRDPGRLKELLIPNVRLLLRPALNTANRKTKFDVLAVLHENRWVLINSGFHSDIAAELIELELINEFKGYSVEKREYTYGQSRIDFLLTSNNDLKSPNEKTNRLLLEIKGCTLVEDGWAKFPDAPTLRGRRHVEELIKAKEEGLNSAVLFLIMRDDALKFSPNWKMDPGFSTALAHADQKRVEIIAYSFNINLKDNFLAIEPFRKVYVEIKKD